MDTIQILNSLGNSLHLKMPGEDIHIAGFGALTELPRELWINAKALHPIIGKLVESGELHEHPEGAAG